MKFYVSENLGKVLNEKEYKELLKREVKEYGYNDIKEAEEKDCDYKEIEIREDLEGYIYYVDSLLKSDIYGDNEHAVRSSMCEDISSTIDNLSYAYPVTDNWNINVKFEIVGLDEERLEDSIIKVTDIELI